MLCITYCNCTLNNSQLISGVIMYKSIMIANSERTPAVIRSAMMKHGLEGSPENFTLSQLLPEKGESVMSRKYRVTHGPWAVFNHVVTTRRSPLKMVVR